MRGTGRMGRAFLMQRQARAYSRGLVAKSDGFNSRGTSLLWDCSSAGRAPALHAGGQGFESPQFHQRRTPAVKCMQPADYSFGLRGRCIVQ